MGYCQEVGLQNNVSCKSKIILSSGYHARSPSSSMIPSIPEHEEFSDYNLLVPCRRCSSVSSSAGSSSNSLTLGKFHLKLSSFLRSLLNVINIPSCKFLTLPSPSSSTHLISLTGGGPSLGRRATGTLYGHRRGHVTFAVQYDPRSDPVLLLELAMSTATLVKEMSTGLVRIALECEKRPATAGAASGADRRPVKLFQEPMWTMYCNGRKSGYAVSRSACTKSDWGVLSTVSRISVGAGVIPPEKCGGGAELGELLYMRAKFERVVGSRDSEAFYMLNPDKNGGPELSIFLLRI